MAKIKVNNNVYEGAKYHLTQYLYNCPACGYEHAFALKTDGGKHDFNMDLDNPTVSPSLLSNFLPGAICHSYIKNGMIRYEKDSDHKLRGQIVPLQEYD